MTLSESNPAIASSATSRKVPAWLLAVLLGLIVMLVYWPATQNGFINYDDDVYVTANEHVHQGLTADNIKWAFTSAVSSNWHPLTMMSHMLDYEIFGTDPFGHHLANVILHSLNTMLVFLWLRLATWSTWRSAIVALLFGLHPLHVQSVAWVAERKDVLSTFFGLFTLIFYVLYTRKRDEDNVLAVQNYLLALLFFIFGLMSKSMLVTFPCVMLLLDYWPLERISRPQLSPAGFKSLILEKVAFFAVAIVMSVVTFFVQKQAGAVTTVEVIPIVARFENVLISYCRYLGKTFWPADLAVFYPHPGFWPLPELVCAGFFLCGITILIWHKRERFPYLLVGWLWFIGTLVPVIGLVQVGEQAMADRYTYISSLGLFIVIAWGSYELTKAWPWQKVILSSVCLAIAVLCIAMTRQQLGYWKDSETLFQHALAVTADNELAENELGLAILSKGRIDDALPHLEKAARLSPKAVEIHNNLGLAYLNKGLYEKAVEQFQQVVTLNPLFVKAHANLGLACLRKGDYASATNEFQETLGLDPDFNGVRPYYGVALFKTGRIDDAIEQFRQTLQSDSNNANAKNNLAMVEGLKREIDAAGSNPAALNNLAWKLAANPDTNARNGAVAVQLAEHACEQTHYEVTVLVGTLAAAYAEAGRFDDAIATAQKACAMALDKKETELLKRNEYLLGIYQSHQTYREP